MTFRSKKSFSTYQCRRCVEYEILLVVNCSCPHCLLFKSGTLSFKVAKPKKAWLADSMFEYKAVILVLISIRRFRTSFRLRTGVVILKVSITSSIVFSNASQDFWCVILFLISSDELEYVAKFRFASMLTLFFSELHSSNCNVRPFF